MILSMRYILALLGALVLSGGTVFAADLSVTAVTSPYEIVPISADTSIKHILLGVLEGFPVMYEIDVATTTTLSFQIDQLYQTDAEPIPFSLMLVRQNDDDGGVTEVARIKAKAEDWQVRKDEVLGFSLWEQEVSTTSVEPGIYRLEISTAVNQGKYRLVMGEDLFDKTGYFSTLGQVRTTQKFFGFSIFRMLLSSYIYYPLGILLLLHGFYWVNRYRKTFKNA